MFFRRTGMQGRTSSRLRRRTPLFLEQLEERCVPSATDLGIAGNYNAFVFADYAGKYSDVEGRLAVGHDASLVGYGVGDRLTNSHGTRDDLIVGHALTYTNGQVFNGNIAYGNSALLSGVGVPNGSVKKTSVIDFAGTQSDLTAKSSTWSQYGTQGTITNNWGNLALTGTDARFNVFDLSAAQLQNVWSVTINAPANSTVLINVSGPSITLQNFGINIIGTDHSRVLFNFNQASSVTLQGIGFQGNILAPNADVTFNNGSFLGTLVAKSFTGSGQLNLSGINIDIPQSLPAKISGLVFNDKNSDGIQEADEPGMSNVTLIIQGVGVSYYNTTHTDINGHFTFSNVPPGHYTIAVVTPNRYKVVSIHVGSAGGVKHLDTGEITGIPLGNAANAIEYDFGLTIPSPPSGRE